MDMQVNFTSKGITIDKVRKMTEDYLGFGDDEDF